MKGIDHRPYNEEMSILWQKYKNECESIKNLDWGYWIDLHCKSDFRKHQDRSRIEADFIKALNYFKNLKGENNEK